MSEHYYSESYSSSLNTSDVNESKDLTIKENAPVSSSHSSDSSSSTQNEYTNSEDSSSHSNTSTLEDVPNPFEKITYNPDYVKLSLDHLLYVHHRNDTKSDDSNIHLFVFKLMYDIVHNYKGYRDLEIYKQSAAIREICRKIKKKIPKSIYKFYDHDDEYECVNSKHRKYTNFIIYSHALTYALTRCGI